MFERIFQWLQDTPFAEAVRASDVLFPWFESVHVLAITLVLGSIAVIDLRLLGVASRGDPLSRMLREVLPITWLAFAIALLTGTALFASNAVMYADNFPFRMKMLVMLVAGLNMLAFHFITCRRISASEKPGKLPTGARFAGGFSIVSWLSIVAFGRWIGFTIGP